MTGVEAAMAEPSARTARARQAGALAVLPQASKSFTETVFPSVLASVRGSQTWLDSLFGPRGERLGTREAPAEPTQEASRCGSRLGKPRVAGRTPPSGESGPSELAGESPPGRVASPRQSQEVEGGPAPEPREPRDGPEPDAVRQAEPKETDSPETSCREPVAEEAAAPVQTEVAATEETPVPPGDRERVEAVPVMIAGLKVCGVESSTAGVLVALTAGVCEPQPAGAGVSVAGPEVAAAQVVPGPEPRAMPSGPSANGLGGQSGDAAEAGGTTKGGDAGPKTAGSTLEFQNLLEQIGRPQGPAGVRHGVMRADRAVPDESIPLTRREGIEALARVVRSGLGGRHASMTLRLDPPELGRLQVDIRLHEQNLMLRFQTQTQGAHDVLEARLNDLRGALERHGIQLDRVEMEVRPPAASGPQGRESEGQSGQQHFPQGGEPGFGYARGQEGGAAGWDGSERVPGQPEQDRPAAEGRVADERGDPAETGVDLIV